MQEGVVGLKASLVTTFMMLAVERHLAERAEAEAEVPSAVGQVVLQKECPDHRDQAPPASSYKSIKL